MQLKGSIKNLRRRLRAVQRRYQGQHRKRMLGEHIAATIMRTGTGLYAIDVEDDAVRPRSGGHRTHGEDEIARAAKFIDRESNVLVVGAHVGTIAIPLARLARGLWAVEANPRTFELLNYSVALNRADNMRTLNLAASDRDEEIEFVANRNNSGGAKRMPKIRAPMYFRDRPNVVRVPAQPLDTVLAGTDFALVFMDCEGSEYYTLKGMQRILGGARALMVEFLPHHLRNVAGVEPEDFVDAIGPGFGTLFIPSKNLAVAGDDIKRVLRLMYDRDEGDAGLVFTR
ncbi:MAG TPA: FkbM family methyltransferase [Stellaceae bacterium]|nr:FkbM family methyltransferase [Stellaceae bacterium]